MKSTKKVEKVSKLKTPEVSKEKKEHNLIDDRQVDDEFDFGGLPKEVPFKRNIGCGG